MKAIRISTKCKQRHLQQGAEYAATFDKDGTAYIRTGTNWDGRGIYDVLDKSEYILIDDIGKENK